MDKNEIITGIVSLMVLAVLFGTAFITAVGAIEEDNQTTYRNEVVYTPNYTVPATYTLDGQDDYKLESNPIYSEFKINGQKVNISRWDYVQQKIITDKCRVEFAGHYTQLYDDTGARIVNVSTSAKNVVYEYDADTKTFMATVYTDLTNTAIETQLSYTVNQILYADPNGIYGAINTNGDPDVKYYVNTLSQVVAGGVYLTGDLDTSYFAEGATVYAGNANYNGSAEANTSDVINGVVEGDSYAVTITDGVNSETFTPFVVYVPLTVKGTTDNQQSFNDLIGILPLVVGAGLLLLAVAYFIRRY